MKITKEELKDFLNKSGLKVPVFADAVNIKKWVVYHFLAGNATLSKVQNERAKNFVSEFTKNNDYMCK